MGPIGEHFTELGKMWVNDKLANDSRQVDLYWLVKWELCQVMYKLLQQLLINILAVIKRNIKCKSTGTRGNGGALTSPVNWRVMGFV
jgi:hypothetical protein